MAAEVIDVRFVMLGPAGAMVKYVRASDVTQLLRALAATEETDTRNRINELADLLDPVRS